MVVESAVLTRTKSPSSRHEDLDFRIAMSPNATSTVDLVSDSG